MLTLRRNVVAVCVTLGLIGACASAGDLPGFDFTSAGEVGAWQPTHDVASVAPTAEGMEIAIRGNDPYIHGPLRDYPADTALWLTVRLKCERAGTGQFFWFTATRGSSPENSVTFAVPKANEWVVARAPLPALGPGVGLRLDPPGVEGKCVVSSISFEPRVIPVAPEWPAPAPPSTEGALSLTSGDLTVRQVREQLGGLTVEVAGETVAVANTRPLIGYATAKESRWLDLAAIARVETKRVGRGIDLLARFEDPDGGRWRIDQAFRPAKSPGAIDVRTSVSVNREREVAFLPLLLLHPGVGSFGAKQDHALFCGLEYMDAPDTSSSEADITGPGSKRQVPDTGKLTIPLMAIQADDRYVGLIWEQSPDVAPVFDSPDRLFGSGGHVMGVLFPGSNGLDRQEGNLLPYAGQVVEAGKPLVLEATIIGGNGTSVIPAVQQYLSLRPLPPIPDTGMDKEGYERHAAAGWLDSKIGENGLYRHAYWPGSSFGAGPAADVAAWMDWLAVTTRDAALRARLEAAAKDALAQVPPGAYDSAGVSHVHYPVESLLYGHVAENTEAALAAGRAALAGFEPDGAVLYRAGQMDFGKTHFAPDANGLTGGRVASLLQCAVVSGDPDLIREGLRLLRALDKFDDSAPRGAQTWEVPLHTPDILASAYLVRAYTLGYELTGDREFLDRAVYWAWTGVPFVYLIPPVDGPVGPYATIPVFGATHWVGSWFGLPVQWCGLVYSDALYRLMRHDPENAALWKQLADGIAASGIQQNFPTDDPEQPDLQGLLPDSFVLRTGWRNGVAINPGTVQSSAIRLVGGPEVYDFRVFRQAGLMVHAPGAIEEPKDGASGVRFRVRGWTGKPYYVLVTGLNAEPTVRVNGRAVSLDGPNQYLADSGRLILQVEGSPTVEVAR